MTMPNDSRQADAIFVDRAALDAAIRLLSYFDPEVHDLEDCALSIAEAMVRRSVLVRGKSAKRRYPAIPSIHIAGSSRA